MPSLTLLAALATVPLVSDRIPFVSDLCGVDVQWFQERSSQALPNSKEWFVYNILELLPFEGTSVSFSWSLVSRPWRTVSGYLERPRVASHAKNVFLIVGSPVMFNMANFWSSLFAPHHSVLTTPHHTTPHINHSTLKRRTHYSSNKQS